MSGPLRLHLLLLAGSVSAIKVVLFTCGTTVALARAGAESMPWFYLVLAAMGVVMSLVLATAVDRRPAMALLRWTFILVGAGAFVLRAGLAYDHPVLQVLTLAGGHLYEIATDIVFWLVAGVYLTSFELRRATPWLLAAMAAGGLAAGIGAAFLGPRIGAENLLLAVPPLAILALLQVRLAGSSLCPLPETDPAEVDEGPMQALCGLPELLRRHPFAALLALNSFMLTLVYSISEYLCFAAYEASFPDEAELGVMLGGVFGLLQASELVLLVVAGPMLMDRAGPLLRNMLFPAMALSSLLLFFSGNRLLAGVLTHVTTEAVSNAVYEPANASNYAALPRHIHGRTRALANGILYPTGLAAGGLLLLAAPGLALPIGIACALIFLALSAVTGRAFLPMLVRHLRGGVEHYAQAAGLERLRFSKGSQHVRDLARTRAPEGRRLALELASRLDSPAAAELLGLLPPDDDPAIRETVGCMLLRLPGHELLPVLAKLATGQLAVDQLLAARLLLARPELPRQGAATRLARSRHPAVALMGRLLLQRGARVASTEAASSALRPATPAEQYLVAVALAGASTQRHVALLAELVELLGEEQVVAALRALSPGAIMQPAALTLAARCLSHPRAAVRLAALGIVAVRPPVAPEQLVHLLEDADPQVRTAAAAAFAAYGKRGVAAAAERLEHPRRAVRHAAIMALGAIGGPEARLRLLRALVPHRRFARESSAWLDLLRRRDCPPAFEDLAAAVESRAFEAVDTGLTVAAALGGGRLVEDLRSYLVARDPRRRADALEALASFREAVAIKPILPLLERQIGREAEHAGATPPAAWSQLTQAASGHDDPWIRRAAQRSVLKLAAAAYGPPRGKAFGTPERDQPELPIERVLSLHQVAMFRNLPLDTLLQVDRVLEQRAYADGEVVADPETGGRYLCILIQGSVLLDRPGLPPRLLQAVATFGEAAVVDELMPAPRAVARGGCIVLRMSAVTFNDLAGEHPEIWVETCRLLARHLEVGPLEVGPLEPAAAA